VRNFINQRKGQTTIEVGVGMVVVMLLLFGSLKIFLWLNERMVRRQVAYENTRVAAGASWTQRYIYSNKNNASEDDLRFQGEILVNDSAYPELNIFEPFN
jgi:hypothetical protein